MDLPLIHESSFSAANPSSYTLTEIWPFPPVSGEAVSAGNGGVGAGLGLRMESLGGPFEVEQQQQQQQQRDGSMEESTVTEQSVGNGKKRRDFSSEDETSKMVSATTSSGNQLNDTNGKRMKMSGSRNEKSNSKAEVGASSAANNKPSEQSSKPAEPPKDYIHVRARRGQATDSHSLAERARREKISERMKMLQDLVPGCNKVIGKALVLDEIINYIQSLQHQVEFLSMKLEAVNSEMNINPAIQGYHAKDPFDGTGMMFGRQTTREYAQGPQPEWLHMQIGGGFARGT